MVCSGLRRVCSCLDSLSVPNEQPSEYSAFQILENLEFGNYNEASDIFHEFCVGTAVAAASTWVTSVTVMLAVTAVTAVAAVIAVTIRRAVTAVTAVATMTTVAAASRYSTVV